MPPRLALILSIGFVIYLFRRESRRQEAFSRDLWIPLIWIWITGSRFVSQWFAIWGLLPGGEGSYEEGSPLDALVFLALIVAGFMVLRKRQVRLATLMQNNVWLAVFFIYCFLAIAWSDFPFVAFKRWIKVLGHPIMTLIILTEPDRDEAIRRLFKRVAYVLIIGSVLCIKYYPEVGRGFDNWTGQAFNQGVNLNKNELGYVCMLLGLFFVWNFMQSRSIESRKARGEERLLSLFFLGLIWWLLSVSSSATSLVCAIFGISMMLVLSVKWVNKRYFGWYVIAGVLLFGVAESTIGVYGSVLKMLGRNATLTDRTDVWADALALADNPVLGAGFESFWLGERREKMWAKWLWHPNQAHNGYIETYLNLGMVGVILLLALAVAIFKKIQRMLLWNFEFGRLRMGFFFAILLYNFTEASFKGVSLVWLVWHIIAIDFPFRPPHVEGVEVDLDCESRRLGSIPHGSPA